MTTTPATTDQAPTHQSGAGPVHVDIAVVGAGFAGLQAALVLGRAQQDVLLVGDGPTRNAETDHAYNILTRDGTAPAELLTLGRAEVEALPTVTTRTGQVAQIATSDGSPPTTSRTALDSPGAVGKRFTLHLSDGSTVTAGDVVVATGARDALPDVPGLINLWGRRAHSCPFCDGEQYAGRELLVLVPDDDVHRGAILSAWTDQITRIDPADVRRLTERHGRVIAETTNWTGEGGAPEVGEIAAEGIFVAVTPMPRVDLVADLPVEHRGGYLAVDTDQRTSLPGLWAVGDCAWRDGEVMPGSQVIYAMASASAAAIGIILDRQGIERPVPPPRSAGAPDGHHGDHGHGHDHEHDHSFDVDPDETASQWWERFYGDLERVWTGTVNAGLAEVVESVDRADEQTALELGAGEGADAVWLAEHGWQTTAVDISSSAIGRGRRAAAERGLEEQITWIAADLADGMPEGQFDLVASSYLLSPVEIPRHEILRQAADRVAPGGRLVWITHLAAPRGGHGPEDFEFPTLEGDLAALGLDPTEPSGAWTIEECGPFRPRMRTADGTVTHREDGRLVLRRSA